MIIYLVISFDDTNKSWESFLLLSRLLQYFFPKIERIRVEWTSTCSTITTHRVQKACSTERAVNGTATSPVYPIEIELLIGTRLQFSYCQRIECWSDKQMRHGYQDCLEDLWLLGALTGKTSYLTQRERKRHSLPPFPSSSSQVRFTGQLESRSGTRMHCPSQVSHSKTRSRGNPSLSARGNLKHLNDFPTAQSRSFTLVLLPSTVW